MSSMLPGILTSGASTVIGLALVALTWQWCSHLKHIDKKCVYMVYYMYIHVGTSLWTIGLKPIHFGPNLTNLTSFMNPQSTQSPQSPPSPNFQTSKQWSKLIQVCPRAKCVCLMVKLAATDSSKGPLVQFMVHAFCTWLTKIDTTVYINNLRKLKGQVNPTMKHE